MKKLVDSKNRENASLLKSSMIFVVPVLVLILLTYLGEQHNKPRSAIELAGQDHFEVLGATKTATNRELKKKFRALALKWHPDKNVGCDDCERRMASITKAYEVLTDPQERAAFESDRQQVAAIDSETTSLDEESWHSTVLQSDEPWLVQIYADWSYPCVLFKAHWERAAGSFEGAVQMGRINLARHRILADNLMGGGVGLPFILAVFKNNTVALPAGSWMDKSKARAAMATTVLQAVGDGRMPAPDSLPGCRDHRVKLTLVAGHKSLARFYFQTLHPGFEEECHLYGIEPTEPAAVAVVGPKPAAPVLLVEQPCGHSSGGVHQIKGPFRKAAQVKALLEQHCKPKPPFASTVSAGSALALCERGCIGSADREISRQLHSAAAQEGDAFTRVVYVHPAEQQHFVDRLPTAQTVFAMRQGTESQQQLTFKAESLSADEFVAQLLDDEVEWQQGWGLHAVELDTESASAALGRRLTASLASPAVMVVAILVAILVGLWAVLSLAQRGRIGRFPVAVIRNVLSHWIQVHDQGAVPKPKTKMAVRVPEDITDLYEAFQGDDEEEGLVAADLLRIAKLCDVTLDQELADEMIDTAGPEHVSLERFFLITQQEVEEESASESEGDDDY